VDYRELPRLGTWELKEKLVFDVMEDMLLADMHAMLHTEHAAMAGAVAPDHFQSEVDGARARYNTCGQLRMPWLKWRQMKTAAQAYQEALERRKDPEHLAMLRKLQTELDSRAKEVSDAVKTEVELAQAAREHRKRLKTQRRRVVRTKARGGLSRRRR